MTEKLRWYEGVYISIRAYYDLKKGRIKILTKELMAQKLPQGDLRTQLDELDTGSSHYVCINSPFVERELANYDSVRNRFLGRRKNLYWFKGPFRIKIYTICSFTKMLGILDEQINSYETHLNLLTMRYGEDILEMNKRHDDHLRRNEPHMVQFYVNQVNALRKKFYREASPYYMSLVQLLTQKVNKLQQADDILTEIRSRYFLRVRTYHEKVCIFSPYSSIEIEPNYLRNEILYMLGSAETAERYAHVKEKTVQDLKKYREELNRVMAGK